MLAKTQVKTGTLVNGWNHSQPSRHLWPRWSLSQWFDTSVPSAQGIGQDHSWLFCPYWSLFWKATQKKRNLCNQGLPGLCKLKSDVCFQPRYTILSHKQIPCHKYYFEPHSRMLQTWACSNKLYLNFEWEETKSSTWWLGDFQPSARDEHTTSSTFRNHRKPPVKSHWTSQLPWKSTQPPACSPIQRTKAMTKMVPSTMPAAKGVCECEYQRYNIIPKPITCQGHWEEDFPMGSWCPVR